MKNSFTLLAKKEGGGREGGSCSINQRGDDDRRRGEIRRVTGRSFAEAASSSLGALAAVKVVEERSELRNSSFFALASTQTLLLARTRTPRASQSVSQSRI